MDVPSHGISREEHPEVCYCSNGEGALQASIDAGTAQIEQLGRTVDRGTAEKSQLEQELKTQKSDRTAAEATMKESIAIL